MVQELEEERKKAKCTFSTVVNYKKLDFQGVPHAGTLSHICSLEKDHEGKCKCEEPCGVEFSGWGK